jgi:hypothetical protein
MSTDNHCTYWRRRYTDMSTDKDSDEEEEEEEEGITRINV